MTKLLFFDTETTGLDKKLNSIISMAGVIDSTQGEIVQTVSFDIQMQPFSYENIDEGALKINHTTIDELKTRKPFADGINEFLTLLDSYIDKYDKNDKFTLVGYNIRFDLDMLYEGCQSIGQKFLMSYIKGHTVDVYEIMKFLNVAKCWNMPAINLGKAIELFNIKNSNEHTSLGDTLAVRELYYYLISNYLK